jgi:hypothetical protein
MPVSAGRQHEDVENPLLDVRLQAEPRDEFLLE